MITSRCGCGEPAACLWAPEEVPVLAEHIADHPVRVADFLHRLRSFKQTSKRVAGDKHDNTATQILIDLAVMDAQGGRESELANKIAEGYAQGLTADNMLAVPLLTAPHNGFPRTLNMRGALASAIESAKTEVSDKTTVTMQIGNPIMTINGAEKNIDENGTVPVVIDDRTLLPVRAFVEGIGGSVQWDEDTQTATLDYKGNEIKLTINSATAYLNNEEKTLDVMPVIINDRTHLRYKDFPE